MFDIVRLGPGDRGLILTMQERIYAALPEKTVFERSSGEFIEYCLDGGGLCYASLRHGVPVGYRMVYFPRGREFNLAKEVPLPSHEWDRVAHWDTTAVQPEWRGHGLGGLMNARALADLAGTGTRHVFATSSPCNPYGVKPLVTAGLRPVRLVRKFGGHLRFLLYRPFPAGWGADSPRGEEKAVALSAITELEAAFRDGWVGAEVVIDEAGARLRMRRAPLPF
ncbi:GNAT family N-acetyltransferase [Streptomyces sp. NPDC026589]|uniref:GNAT family N-acetyltransferase n=1 Tax=Streptomyces sp. NPDC026589 TaxID=3155609 RepID=UPI003404EDF7